MTTKETIETYFEAVRSGDEWADYLADEVVFTNHAVPVSEVSGREACVQETKGFYGMIESVEVNSLIVDEDAACALTTYLLQPPGGDSFTSDVAEFFTVNDDRIKTFDIYFDSAAFPS